MSYFRKKYPKCCLVQQLVNLPSSLRVLVIYVFKVIFIIKIPDMFEKNYLSCLLTI